MTPSTLRKLALFGLVGVMKALVDWATFWALGAMLPNAVDMVWLAKGASYCVGVLTSFFLNARITFRQEYRAIGERDGGRRRAFVRFWLVAIVCLAINSLTYEVMRGTVYFDLVALVGATVVTYLTGFFLNLRWTFPARVDSATN